MPKGQPSTGNSKADDLWDQAVTRADRKIDAFEDAVKSGDPKVMQKAALDVQADPVAVNRLNKRTSPPTSAGNWFERKVRGLLGLPPTDPANSLRAKHNEITDAIKKKTRQLVRDAYALEKMISPAEVTFFEATNPTHGNVKVGQDWDVTVRVNGKDVSHLDSGPVVNRAYYEAVHGQPPPTQAAADQLAHRQAIETTSAKHAEAYGGNPAEGEEIIKGKDKSKPLRDPGQLANTVDYKSNQALNHALDLEDEARELKAAADRFEAKGDTSQANKLRAQAHELELDAQGWHAEQYRQQTKQFDRQIKPRVEARGGKVPRHVENGIEILREVERGNMTPTEARNALKAMGETPQSIITKSSGLIDASQTLGKPPIKFHQVNNLPIWGHVGNWLTNAWSLYELWNVVNDAEADPNDRAVDTGAAVVGLHWNPYAALIGEIVRTGYYGFRYRQAEDEARNRERDFKTIREGLADILREIYRDPKRQHWIIDADLFTEEQLVWALEANLDLGRKPFQNILDWSKVRDEQRSQPHTSRGEIRNEDVGVQSPNESKLRANRDRSLQTIRDAANRETGRTGNTAVSQNNEGARRSRLSEENGNGEPNATATGKAQGGRRNSESVASSNLNRSSDPDGTPTTDAVPDSETGGDRIPSDRKADDRGDGSDPETISETPRPNSTATDDAQEDSADDDVKPPKDHHDVAAPDAQSQPANGPDPSDADADGVFDGPTPSGDGTPHDAPTGLRDPAQDEGDEKENSDDGGDRIPSQPETHDRGDGTDPATAKATPRPNSTAADHAREDSADDKAKPPKDRHDIDTAERELQDRKTPTPIRPDDVTKPNEHPQPTHRPDHGSLNPPRLTLDKAPLKESLLFERYLRLHNNTKEPLSFSVRYYSFKQGAWRWFPSDGSWLKYTIAPGKTSYLQHGGANLHANQVRFTAKIPSSGQWNNNNRNLTIGTTTRTSPTLVGAV